MTAGTGLADTAQDFNRFSIATPQTADGQTATLLSDGRWLFVGGRDSRSVSGLIVTRDFRSPDQQAQIPALASTLVTPRFDHTATVLPDGSVFIYGGFDQHGAPVRTAEVLDPRTGEVSVVGDPGLRPRARHSATLLTDGRVLLSGGVAGDGTVLQDAELWNPDTQQSEPALGGLVEARADHSSALLANGKGLLWGGQDRKGEPLTTGELFDPTQKRFGTVNPADDSELPPAYLNDMAPRIEATLPAAGATDVPVSTRIAVRFSTPVQVDRVSDATVTVVGPAGAVSGKIVAAANGQLAFFTPNADLLPGATYTLFLSGLTGAQTQSLPWTTLTFSTRTLTDTSGSNPSGPVAQPGTSGSGSSAPGAPANAPVEQPNKPHSKSDDRKKDEKKDRRKEPVDDEFEDWIPGARHRHGQWRVLGIENEPRANGRVEVPAALQAGAGVTALSGRVARLNGRPIAGVKVSVGSVSTQTDNRGRFLLAPLSEGTQELTVDGSRANSAGRRYTTHFIQVDVAADKTTVLPQPIFMARINPAHEVTIPSPADRELVITNPSIPGLELHIPKGAILRTRDGRIVTRLSITPLPIDRVPFAVPTGFPVYFTVQPAGAFVDNTASGTTEGIRVIYPNYLGLRPRSRVAFWNYDPAGAGWQVYGHGTVTSDGKQVVPDPGVTQKNLMAFGWGLENVGNAPADGPAPGNCGSGACSDRTPNPSPCMGDPVDCATGLFIHRVTDFFVADTIPIVLSRTYRQNDSLSRDFGIGTNHSYGMFLSNPTGSTSLPTTIDLILQDGGRVRFGKILGSQSSDIVYQHTSSPTRFQGATLRISTITHAWEMTLTDKSVYIFQPHNPNLLIGYRDRYGNTLTLTRNGSLITQILSPHGRYINFTYDTLNRITLATDNVGRMVRYEYDAAGHLWRVTDTEGKVEQYGYDANDRMTTVTDKRGNTMVTNVFDANGRVSQQTLADNAVWHYSYALDGLGNVSSTTVTDPRNYVTQMTFNSAHYLTQLVRAVGQPEQQSFSFTREDGSNLLLSETDALGRVTRFTYDYQGNVTSMTRLYGTPDAVTASLTYDSGFGQLTSYTDPLNHQVQLAYDGLGNLTGITDALGHSTTMAYDSEGKPQSVTSALSKVTQLNYDGADLASVSDPLGHTVSVFTDAIGRVIGLADPLGNRVRYDYDAMNRPLRTTDALGGVTQLTYDANGNLRTVRDARDLANHEYTYDVRNRVKTYKDPLGKIESYDYDAMGNQIARTDRKNQVTGFQYDALNRPTLITFADSSTITLTWDAGNRLHQIVDSVNGTITRDYDSLDRLTRELSPEGQVDYGYDAAGRRTQMTVSGLPSVTYQYDAGNRITQIARGSTIVAFNYDAMNRRTGVTLPNGIAGTYTYNDAGQVVSIAYDQGATHLGELSYTYDAAGRRIGQSGSLARLLVAGSISGATYDAANRLTNWGGSSLSYDDGGNLATLGSSSFSWNARDQLVATSDGSATYQYDALGRRRSRTVAGVTTPYLHDGGSAATVAGEQLLAGAGLDEMYASIGSSATTTRLVDALGSTVALTDDSGSTTANFSYGAYGQASKTGTGDTPFQYTGRENDGATNLYYYRARYYSPILNRFISSDPIGFSGGANFYGYAFGNPISRADPLGLAPPSLPQGVVDAVAGFGDGIYGMVTLGFGDLNALRNELGWGNGVNLCSVEYQGGHTAGSIWGGALLWSAGLNGGANTVFWSGFKQGARQIAESSLGTTLEMTPIGGTLDFLSNTVGIPGLEPLWNAASATFAWNAKGTVTAVILAEGTTWTTIELPVLLLRGVPITMLF